VVYGLKQLAQDGLAWLPVLSMVMGCGLAALFLRRQRQLSDPMVDLSLFRNRAFSVSLASNVLNVFVSFGSFILVSQYLQLALGLSPLQAAVLSVPASLAAIVGPMLSPALAQRVGVRVSLAALLAIAGTGFAIQGLAIKSPVAVVTIAAGWALWALGGSAAATLSTGLLLGSARPERAGAVSALAQTGAELGGALGIAVLGSLGAAMYRGMVLDALPAALSPEQAAAARETLVGALGVASQLGDPEAAATLVSAAQHGLALAVQTTSVIAAVVSLLSAAGVALYFSQSRPTEPRTTVLSLEDGEPALAC
jgi:DHA2 family multidrug resistance protein-like MFS transporter